jgi:hypothetical protein
MSPPTRKRSKKRKDDFESVAKRLECDPDLDKFDAKLRKIAKVKTKVTRASNQ